MNSEVIYQALFDRLSTNVQGLKTVSRRLRHFNNVTPDERPAMFITQGNQQEVPVHGLDSKVELAAEVYLYIHETDRAKPPSSQMNIFIDRVRDAIQPDHPEFSEYQTLGGLVEHCWIEGTVEVYEAVENMLDDQAIAIIPIRILTTN
ncbi:Uncharacterised protein [Acinetobacter baumannii]|uniref:hypothetical protein n=1 Tax=Acinetobacter baumannii TaxID=470 RepID=UPI000DE785C2|nr:hypothetical protein [Acinetobacter baumannii]MDC5554819.1 hypothetical protein [Acinetobacter baumannii]SSO97922.1 Uncharacterised protein [Acinetobacter baumannii]HAV5432052.1 hypothetical protein [Acinetobacter baumannii]